MAACPSRKCRCCSTGATDGFESRLAGKRLRNFDVFDIALNHLVLAIMNAVLAVEQHALRVEELRLKGERVARARTIDVFDPYTNTRVGTVPMASVDDVRDAFEYAANYRATAHAL